MRELWKRRVVASVCQAVALLPLAAAAADFTLIALPDTQYYTANMNGGTPAILQSQVDWVVSNRAARNIVYVNQLGDCSDHGDQYLQEWLNATNAFYRLENPATTGLPDGIPYGVSVGNHDLMNGGPALFNKYFGVTHFQNRSYYGGHYGSDNQSYYDLFRAGGMDFIVLSLTYDAAADSSLMAWADQILKANANRRAIVITHSLLNIGNPAPWTAQGQAIFDGVKANTNVFLMLCGHEHGTGIRTETYNGNTINLLLSDYQSLTPYAGNGYLRIMTFSPAAGQISVKTYSPFLDAYLTDSGNQFTLNYAMSAPSSTAPTITITNPAGSAVSVAATQTSFAVFGTVDSNAVGRVVWSAAPAGASGTFAVAPSWAFSGIPLVTGANTIVVMATNAVGVAASDSAVVTRLSPPSPGVAAPVILAATGIGSSQFTANWTAVPGATGYWLDVATNPAFRAASGWSGGGSVYRTGFETPATKTAYTSAAAVIDGLAWTLSEALIGTLANDKKNGAQSARVRSSGSLTMNADTNAGLSAIAFLYGGYGTDPATSGRVDASSDAGATWQSVGTFSVTSGQALTPFVVTNLTVQGNVRMRIVKTDGGGTSTRFNIDDLALYPYGTATGDTGDFVPGYQGLSVSAPGVVVTGLTAGATYYYRAMATDGVSNSAYSAVTNVAAVTDPNQDTDGDGLPDWWELKYFGDPVDADPFADGDADGFNNISEYIADTDPTNPASYPAIRAIDWIQGAMRINFPASTARVYHVEYSDSGMIGVWSNLTTDATATGAVMTLQDAVPAPMRFYRFRVRLP